MAPDTWPVPSSKAGGVFGVDGTGVKNRRGRGVRAGGGADVTCPSLLFVFQVCSKGGEVRGGGGGVRMIGCAEVIV